MLGGAQICFRMAAQASAAACRKGPVSALPACLRRCLSSQPRDTHPSGLTFHGNGKGMGLDIPASRPAYYQPSPLPWAMERVKYLLKLTGALGLKATTGVSSEAIFRSIEEQATQNVWFEALGMKRTWISEHALLALHVWLLANRFKVDYNCSGLYCGRRMQEQLFERFWEDTTLRIRNAGIAEISVNKQLENVQKITFDDFFSYDAAIKADVEAEEAAAAGLNADGSGPDGAGGAAVPAANMELAAALWKGVFREDDAANSEAVLMLADYTRRELVSVLTQPKEDVYRGWISWGPCVGESPAQRTERQRRMLEGEWREALDLKGQVYFYHTATQERRWEPPAEGLYDRRRFALTRFLEARSGSEAAALLDTSRKAAKLEAGKDKDTPAAAAAAAAAEATPAAAGAAAPHASASAASPQ